jgi:DNA-binding NarL/FixJ family response regulator
MTHDEPIRILIAEPSKSLRTRMRRCIKEAGHINIRGEAQDLPEAMQRAAELSIDVIVINDCLPPMENGHASVILRRQGVLVSILSFTAALEPELIQHSFRHGVNGLMHIDEIDNLLARAIRRVCKGERYYSPKVRKVYFDL